MGIETAIIGASVLGAAGSAFASSSAADAQADAARQSAAAQERMFQKQIELQEPFRQAGLTSQNQLLTLLGLQGGNAASAEYGAAAKPFGMDQFQADPGYAFRLSEGQKALERSAAARGGLLSGSTLKGAQRFGQDYGTQEYTNAFNRYQTERAARLNPLQSLMGSGQTSANTLTAAAGQTGQGLAQSYGNMGQARASGYVGVGNALTNALSQGVGLYAQMPYLNAQTNYLNRMAGVS
jgi:hypothetical protein